jgi:hypothetical protein
MSLGMSPWPSPLSAWLLVTETSITVTEPEPSLAEMSTLTDRNLWLAGESVAGVQRSRVAVDVGRRSAGVEASVDGG